LPRELVFMMLEGVGLKAVDLIFFFFRRGCQVQFLEAGLKKPVPRKVTFADADKIRELARSGEALGGSEAKQMLEHAIETGRGGVYLTLNLEQYARLKRS
jgi:hypothetical protein